ncbi:hypothetical protein DXG01_007268, partial [Tephrocybe rancida]
MSPSTSIKADTRCFTTPRISSLSGYEVTPTVEPILTFDSMPSSSMYVGRLVEKDGELWELWSPNSSTKAYCPGYVLNSFKMVTPPQHLWRADGHLGRFDPTVNPQMYNIRPWYAFVLRRPPEGRTLREYPEHNALRIAWVSDPPPATTTGRIHAEHLYELFNRNDDLEARILKLQPLARRKSAWWSFRPTDPPSELIKSLRSKVLEFEDAVDLYAQITRGIKLKAAWLEFISRKNHDIPWSMRAMRLRPMETADDNFMGLWINSAQPEEAYWLIRQRIPVFIIHKVTEMEERLCEGSRRLRSFVVDTDIERLAADRNYLEYCAAKSNKLLPPLPSDEWILAPHYLKWDMLNPNHFRYSLSRTYSLPGMMGCTTYGAEEDMAGGTLFRVDPGSSQDDRPPLPVDPQHLPRPLNTEEIDPDHVLWIRPPEIAHPPSGKWTYFTESSDEAGDGCMRKVNSEDNLGKYVWFDRKRRRKLGFDSEPAVLPGITTDVSIFGMPAPNIRYEHRAHNNYVAESRSRWMYQTRTPTRQDFLARIVRPTKSSLPHRSRSNSGTNTKTVPLFSSTESDDEEEYFSDHEDDLFPSFKERARIAAAKGEQELPKHENFPPPPPIKPVNVGVNVHEKEAGPISISGVASKHPIPAPPLTLDAATARPGEEGANLRLNEPVTTGECQTSRPGPILGAAVVCLSEEGAEVTLVEPFPSATMADVAVPRETESTNSPVAATARLESENTNKTTTSSDAMDVDLNDDILDPNDVPKPEDFPPLPSDKPVNVGVNVHGKEAGPISISSAASEHPIPTPPLTLDAATARPGEEGANLRLNEPVTTGECQTSRPGPILGAAVVCLSEEGAEVTLVEPFPSATMADVAVPRETESTDSPVAATARLESENTNKTTTPSDAMDVDPNDDILDYGVSDDEMPPVAPVESKGKQREDLNQDTPASGNEVGFPRPFEDASAVSSCLSQSDEKEALGYDVETTMDESTVERVSDLVIRRAAGELGIIDLVSSRRPTEFLVITGAPVQDVIWEDYLATVAKLIKDGTLFEGQFVQVVRTLQGPEQLFWMRSPAVKAAISGRGYLSARYTTDEVTLNCSFVSHTEYQDAWRRRTHVWPDDDTSTLNTHPPDQPIT